MPEHSDNDHLSTFEPEARRAATPTDVSRSDIGAAAVALDTQGDAKNRAARTALQALVVAVLVDVIPIVTDALDDEAVEWGEVGQVVLRVALMAVLSFVMRYVTPPPAPSSEVAA